ncbi:MAG: PAS domain S-box protein [Chloroflexi bacterium]|nr:PAS domain S-box protein [Chloroflexota bacterium]
MNGSQAQCTYQNENSSSDLASTLPFSQLIDILEGMSDAIFTVDEHWRLTYVNRKTEEIWGRCRADLLGHNIWSIFPQAIGTSTYHAYLGVMRERRAATFEYFSPVVNRWLAVSAYPNGSGLVAHFSDISEQKQAQTALAEERNLLRTLIDALPDYIYVKDTDHRYILINVAGAHSFGVSPAETIGQDSTAFLPIEMALQFHADEDQLLQSGLPLINHEERSIGPQGQPIWAATTKVPLRNLNGDLIGLVGITRDITEHKQREYQLRYYASLQEDVNDAVIATDLAFRIQSWNRAAETIYGWRADEVIGKRVTDCLPVLYTSDDQSNARARQALLEHGQWQGEIVQHRKDGTELYMLSSVTLLKDERGLPCGVVGVNHDITERRRAAEALREQRDFLQLVINSVPDLIMVKDDAGRFQLVNTSAAQIYGLTPAAMVGRTEAEMNPNPTEVAFFRQKDQEARDTGQAVFIPEQTILNRYYQTSKIPLKNPTGASDRLLVVSSDITERRRVEEKLWQAFDKEKELSELKSHFFSMASHEFRNPLASILLVTEMLSLHRHKLTDAQIEQRLGRIQEQVYHLKEIMEDVLELAYLEARRVESKPSRFDLDALCRSVLAEFQSQSEGNYRLSYTCDETFREVKLDPKLMRQIITNLISNALKYSPADKPILIRLVCTADACVIQVQDEGIGIPEADLKYLFEPFHRAANVGTIGGTGLGLAIAKKAVERQGGALTVESQVGVGTMFTVRIPLVFDDEENADEISDTVS